MPRKSARRKKKFLFWQRGNIALYLLLAIIIIGAYFLVGGTSNFTNSPVDKTPAGEMIPETPGTERESLQLQTIRFKKCSNQLTVDLLLDVSGSMSDPTETNVTKISRLKEAVSNLTGKFADSSVIGVQTFRGIGIPPVSSLTDLVPISYYKDVKSTLPPKINSLSANGATPTHDALAFSYSKLREAQPKFPDRKFNFILISDGAPCPGVACPGISGRDQDPREGYNPNPADQIKSLGVNVFTIGIYDKSQAKDINLEGLLKHISSKPENYFDAGAGDAVKDLLNVIGNRICSETN